MSKVLKPSDFELFTAVAHVSINKPHSNMVAFTAVKPSITSNDYLSRVEVYNLEKGVNVFTSQGGKDALPRWSPDGSKLYYLSVGSDGKHQLVEHIVGDGSRAVFVLDKPIKDYRVCGDGTAFMLMQDYRETPDPDYIYTNAIQVWHDGVGFTYHTVTRLYRVDLHSGSMDPVTGLEGDVIAFDVDRECCVGVVAIAERREAPFLSRLYLLDARTLKLDPLLSEEYFVMSVSVEGSLAALAAHRMERGLTSHLRLMVVDLSKKEVVRYETPMGKAVVGVVYNDVGGPAFTLPKPRVFDERVYFTLSEGGRNTLYVWEPGLDYRPLILDEAVVLDFDVDGSRVVYVRSDDATPLELYKLDLSTMSEARLTNYNKWLSQYRLSKPKYFRFEASDGAPVEGWVMEPVERKHEVNGKSPAILVIHGGPKNKYGYSFMFEYQLLAASGYYVIYMNPRGSDGYSEEFADIRYHYGERDFMDLMEGLDHVLKNHPQIDPGRLGVGGISYGGFMTNWVITHTDRFKAAVSEDGISYWLGDYGVTDIGFIFVPDQICETPIKNPEVLEVKSPTHYVENVKTPVLFIHGLNDYRCYIDQALVMYTALRHLGKEAAIALFKDSPHAFSMVGKPSTRLKRYELLLRWYEKHLKPDVKPS